MTHLQTLYWRTVMLSMYALPLLIAMARATAMIVAGVAVMVLLTLLFR